METSNEPMVAYCCSRSVALARGGDGARPRRRSPAPRKTDPIALVGGTVHPVSGPAIESGTCCSTAARSWPSGATWQCPRKPSASTSRASTSIPGLIDANSQLGLVEVPSRPRLARSERNRADQSQRQGRGGRQSRQRIDSGRPRRRRAHRAHRAQRRADHRACRPACCSMAGPGKTCA